MNGKQIKILLIEDNPGDARLIREMLEEVQHTPIDLDCVDRLSNGLKRQAEKEFEVILLDLSLPDSQGFDTFIRMHEGAANIPIIVLTGFDDEALAVKAVREGAQDYLVKGLINSNLLVRAVRYAIERHHMLEELEQVRQQQLDVKDQFLSYISHELRSPLTGIYQFATILSDGLAGGLNSKQREYLEIVLRNVEQLRTMIDELLEATRAETGKLIIEPKTISLVELITETVRIFQTSAVSKGIILCADIPTDLPPVYADPDRVRQILFNLIDNGIKFTSENGTITLHAYVFNETPHYICVAVEDTGCGISPEGTQMIFERLYQEEESKDSQRNGLGLGLYICKELISLHGGRIWVESQLGKGSTVYFTLPMYFVGEPSMPAHLIEQTAESSVRVSP